MPTLHDLQKANLMNTERVVVHDRHYNATPTGTTLTAAAMLCCVSSIIMCTDSLILTLLSSLFSPARFYSEAGYKRPSRDDHRVCTFKSGVPVLVV